ECPEIRPEAPGRVRHQRECDDGGGENGQIGAGPAGDLVPGHAAGGEQAPVLGRKELRMWRVPGGIEAVKRWRRSNRRVRPPPIFPWRVAPSRHPGTAPATTPHPHTLNRDCKE